MSRSYTKGFYQNAPSRFAPPAPEAAGMSTRSPRCSDCSAEIVFLPMIDKHGKPTGNRMPCDPTLLHGDGRRHLVVRIDVGGQIYGQLKLRAPEGVHGFEPHHGTCPVRLKKRDQERERKVGRAWLDEMLNADGGGAA